MQTASIFPLGRGDKLERWRDRLAEGLKLVAAPAERVELVYYDSFDWRLHSAGLLLQYVQSPDSRELRLLRLSDRSVEAALPTEKPTARFASQLPAGELRSRIEPLLGIRAFLPLAGLRGSRYCLRQEDKEGKTRVRLHLESFSVLDGAGKRRPLQKRLRLEALRGYRKAAEGLGTKLLGNYGLAATGDELFEQALAAVGRRPGDYSGKLAVDLQARERADVAVRKILVSLLETIRANEAGTIADLDSEFLHDFRVAVRRTRSMLGELKRVFAPTVLARFRREFAWLGSITGPVRDLDVYLLKFDRYKAAIPAELRDDLEPLREFLRYKQHAEQTQKLAVELKGRRYRKLKDQWERYLTSRLAKNPAARDAARPIGLVAHQRTWRMYKRVLKEGRAITPESPPPELHELRKSCKKLRYLMEFFLSLYPGKAMRAAIAELKQLQDNLGDFQDIDVQIDSLKRFAMEMRRRGEYSDATAKAMDALLAVLEAQVHTVRAEFEAHFRRFDSKDNHRSYKRLFHPDIEVAVT
ncbi:MAG: CHAD domain-containing protein [Gammaproteobacteria bacterium]|jgi:CHAD domain-containing protein